MSLAILILMLKLIVKTNYKYYLANGACIEYALSPGCSLVDVIDGLVASYFSASSIDTPDEVWMKPELVSTLLKECSGRFSVLLGNLPDPIGMQVLRLQTVTGSVTIVAKPGLDFPIFLGSEQELKDNSFNTSMEEILCE